MQPRKQHFRSGHCAQQMVHHSAASQQWHTILHTPPRWDVDGHDRHAAGFDRCKHLIKRSPDSARKAEPEDAVKHDIERVGQGRSSGHVNGRDPHVVALLYQVLLRQTVRVLHTSPRDTRARALWVRVGVATYVEESLVPAAALRVNHGWSVPKVLHAVVRQVRIVHMHTPHSRLAWQGT